MVMGAEQKGNLDKPLDHHRGAVGIPAMGELEGNAVDPLGDHAGVHHWQAVDNRLHG
jgi:hypothetical protein